MLANPNKKIITMGIPDEINLNSHIVIGADPTIVNQGKFQVDQENVLQGSLS